MTLHPLPRRARVVRIYCKLGFGMPAAMWGYSGPSASVGGFFSLLALSPSVRLVRYLLFSLMFSVACNLMSIAPTCLHLLTLCQRSLPTLAQLPCLSAIFPLLHPPFLCLLEISGSLVVSFHSVRSLSVSMLCGNCMSLSLPCTKRKETEEIEQS